ncbi:nuclease Le1 [Mycena floridula]|nr:nuclease Le1 [Mycena floridula]
MSISIMRVSSIATVAALLASATNVYGWGAVGHETIGFVAMPFLAPKALAAVKSMLAANFSSTLGGTAATWADTVRSEAAFAFSAPFHFVDAEDNPPSSCSVSVSRDCGSEGCVLTAIANYTARLINTSLSATQRQQALLFVDHFVGDIGQPLHVEAFEVGGNDVSTKCNGASTNLHAVWDTGMITELVNDNFAGSAQTWATSLVNRIKTGDFESSAVSWISCTTTTGTTCPLVWAKEANALDCSFVFTYTKFTDLCSTSYFTGAVPLIESQIAKQGYRLAAWLNLLFDGATNLP